MANRWLIPVFRALFDKDFNPESAEDRLEMQNAVYLLQSLGISVGNYGFIWYKHGLYSQALQNDILTIRSKPPSKPEFSFDAKKKTEEKSIM